RACMLYTQSDRRRALLLRHSLVEKLLHPVPREGDVVILGRGAVEVPLERSHTEHTTADRRPPAAAPATAAASDRSGKAGAQDPAPPRAPPRRAPGATMSS